MTNNNVKNPTHYNKHGIECIKAIEASMTPEQFKGYLKGNVIKYVWRFEYKNGKEDIEKAQVYLGWLNDRLQANAKMSIDDVYNKETRDECSNLLQEVKQRSALNATGTTKPIPPLCYSDGSTVQIGDKFSYIMDDYIWYVSEILPDGIYAGLSFGKSSGWFRTNMLSFNTKLISRAKPGGIVPRRDV